MVVLPGVQLDVADLGVYVCEHQKSLFSEVGQKRHIVRARIKLTESIALSPVFSGDRDGS